MMLRESQNNQVGSMPSTILGMTPSLSPPKPGNPHSLQFVSPGASGRRKESLPASTGLVAGSPERQNSVDEKNKAPAGNPSMKKEGETSPQHTPATGRR